MTFIRVLQSIHIMNITDIRFSNNKGLTLAGRIYSGDSPSKNGVIFCHGLFSSKDAYKLVQMSHGIVAAGFNVLSFDFSFAGDSGGDFSDFSILQEVEDLRSAVRFFLDTGITNLHLIGSSMGGVVLLLFASESFPQIKSLSVIATPVKLYELLGKLTNISDFGALPVDGMTPIDGVKVKNTFFREVLSIDMINHMAKIKTPVLILHGEHDDVVDFSNAHLISQSIPAVQRVVLVQDGNHHLTRPSDIRILQHNIISWMLQHS